MLIKNQHSFFIDVLLAVLTNPKKSNYRQNWIDLNYLLRKIADCVHLIIEHLYGAINVDKHVF